MFENSYYTLVIECDENSHVNYEYDCEMKRMNNIYEQIGYLLYLLDIIQTRKLRVKRNSKKFENKN